jgi:hypothetical protein
MKNTITIFCILSFYLTFGQNPIKEIESVNGIWVAEDYYTSFEETKSAVESKNAFNFNYPVALRVNSKEIINGVLNIGYSELHDHIIHPEISDYSLNKKDTIRERCFKVNLNKKDSVGYYKTTDISYFNYEWISYITWNDKKTTLILYKPRGKEHKETFIRYKRVTSEFKDDYLFPNPLYYYTRQKTIKGVYTLKDNNGIILSENFEIKENGIANGFEEFENFTFYFSTDIYCGLPHKSDFIIICKDILDNDSKTCVFLIDRKENGNINFHKRKMSDIDEYYVLGEKVYELTKN